MGKETKNTVNLIVTIAVALMCLLILWGIYGTIRKEASDNYNAVNTTVNDAKSALDTAIADLTEETTNSINNIKYNVNVVETDSTKNFKALNEKLDGYADEITKAQDALNENLSKEEESLENLVTTSKEEVIANDNVNAKATNKLVTDAKDSILSKIANEAEDIETLVTISSAANLAATAVGNLQLNSAITTAKNTITSKIETEAKSIKDLIGSYTDASTAKVPTKTVFGKLNDLTLKVASLDTKLEDIKKGVNAANDKLKDVSTLTKKDIEDAIDGLAVVTSKVSDAVKNVKPETIKKSIADGLWNLFRSESDRNAVAAAVYNTLINLKY